MHFEANPDTSTSVPSEPASANDFFHGYRVFEHVRRPTVRGRRCSPADNSFVAIDRAIAKGRFALLLRRAHPCSATSAIAEDARDRSLSMVGLDLIDAVSGSDDHVDVLISGCPGVRLRALAEKSAQTGHPPSADIVWHLVRRTEALLAAWARAGIAPGDTFVAFDGSIHFFPRLDACTRSEAPSYVGDEVWDSFVVNTEPTTIAQLVCGTTPAPCLTLAREFALRAAGIPPSQTPTVPQAVEKLLAARRTSTDATGPLSDWVRFLFPAVYVRHRSLYAELGLRVEDDGQACEERVLAGLTPPQASPERKF